ncbi:hypothetical protein F4803DRAFT_557227 [Xylaria telfairii]|nr:hypothetical protein F4803DRAFT_557227 [Xylaria telfairii]
MDVLFANLGEQLLRGRRSAKDTQREKTQEYALSVQSWTPGPEDAVARFIDVHGAYVSQIIERSLFEQEDTDDGSFAIGQIEDPKKLQEKKKLQHPSNEGRTTAAKSGNMPLEQLIRPLVYALHAESLEYTFPHLTMHRLCWRLLRTAKDSCGQVLRQLYAPAYLEKECQLAWLVGWILIAASGLNNGVSDRRPLQLAADAMNVMLDAEIGSIICTDVLGKQLRMPVEFKFKLDDDDEEEFD